MEAVAEHINEMQKIFEEYGTIFDQLSKMFRDLYPHKKVWLLRSALSVQEIHNDYLWIKILP